MSKRRLKKVETIEEKKYVYRNYICIPKDQFLKREKLLRDAINLFYIISPGSMDHANKIQKLLARAYE